MADIKIKEGSLNIRLAGTAEKIDADNSVHTWGQAVHIQFRDPDNKVIANYTFVKGELKRQITVPTGFGPDDIDQFLNFVPEEVEW